ncbi:hypothetical protein [Methylobacter svalbardensis]|uniref:hypothetical protein n=1 Tax=Methylobacter svalbardensis TaxID=3080016 RepID=UPI0030EB7C1A
MKTYHQPSGLTQGLDFLMNSDWTPEQALAVVELLDDLRDRILLHYQLPIMELMREERGIDPFDDLVDTNIWRENGQPF